MNIAEQPVGCKKILGIHSAPAQHWVGDGFPVRSLFSYSDHGRFLSPFLLLDYAGPMDFEPTDSPRGVGQHPHRGFETVTIVYKGEVAHRDSTGSGGIIGPGDVQWMTAASGILHEEFHSQAFSKSGGKLEMVQLWVNLPSRDKMSKPGYQTLQKGEIPTVPLTSDAGQLRVIAGSFGRVIGPARTFSPLDLWDVHLQQGKSFTFDYTEGRTLALVVLHGSILCNNSRAATRSELVILDQASGTVRIDANTDSTILVLGGEPLNEPVAGHGPFVMNSREEISKAIEDFNSGNFGKL